MPINEPIKNRKVAPASLAFEGDSTGRGAIFQVGTTPNGPTYQEIVNNYTINFALTLITNQQLEANTDELMNAMANAEARAKHSVGDYKHVLQWDIQQNQVYQTGVLQNIAFNTEIIRTAGAMSYGTPANNTARWYFVCPEECEGAWWFHCHLNIRHQVQDNVREAALLFMINDTIWRIVDQVDNNMMGENQIQDMRLAGGCHVPLNTGDRFSVAYLIDGGINPNTATYPLSLYSYISGHREVCKDFNPLNVRSSGMQYTFSHQQN